MINLEELRARLSLIALAEEAGARFDHPHRLSSRCPLPRHDGDRSSRAFTIYAAGRMWKCHSACPADANGGDVFAFYIAWKSVDFKTAVKELAERVLVDPMQRTISTTAGNELSHTPPAPEPQWRERAGQFIIWAERNLAGALGAGARHYLEHERGLSPETWRAFRLGFNPTNFYDAPERWGLQGKKIWLPRGIVIPGFWQGEAWYLKVRRPRPGDILENYIGAWNKKDGASEIKFGGPRGGRSVLFRLEHQDHLPVLFLVEGEWDAMLVWEHAPDLCDVGTLGGAGAHFDLLDLNLLTRYPIVLVLHDDDAAGAQGRAYIARLNAITDRIQSIPPPAHDLTDFWKAGGNVRRWLARHVVRALGESLTSTAPERWRKVIELARNESESA